MVPHLNGWEVCRRLEQDADTRAIPVIMVTGRAEEGDKVLGFEMGADDYVTKPFSPRELVARVPAVVRRGRADNGERRTHVRVGGLEIDRHRFEVRLKGRAVELTPKEFELLAILAGSPGRVFGREELLDAVWGRDGFAFVPIASDFRVSGFYFEDGTFDPVPVEVRDPQTGNTLRVTVIGVLSDTAPMEMLGVSTSNEALATAFPATGDD